MTPDLDKKLCEQFPLLYKNRRKKGPQPMVYFGFEVGDGWYPIIHLLSIKLEALIHKYMEEKPRLCEHCGHAESEHPNKKHVGQPSSEESSHELICPEFLLDYPKAVQVKEKFGGLRFYMSGFMTTEMENAINDAEEVAWKTCEVCGKPGSKMASGWIKVKCNECVAQNRKV